MSAQKTWRFAMRQPTTDIGGIRSYRLQTGTYASVSACLDHISAKRFLPDQEHLRRGEVLHEWTTWALMGVPYNPPEGFDIKDFDLYVNPVLQFFVEHHAQFSYVEETLHDVQYKIAGTPDLACSMTGFSKFNVANHRENWIIDLKFAEALIERYDFQLHGYRLMEPLRGRRMGLLQVNRAGERNFVEVQFDSNKTTLMASAANVLRWQMSKAARDLTECAQ